MAAGAICRLRMTTSTVADVEMDPIYDKLKNRNFGRTCYKFVLTYAGTFSNGYTAISAANEVFNGTSTAAKLWVVSNDAKDTVAGVGAQKVTLIGIDSTGAFATEEVSMAGATDVQTTTTWQRVLHMFVSQVGSENDAAGTIILEDDNLATHTYLTIAAGNNDSDGCIIYIPANYAAQITECILHTTAITAASRGCSVDATYAGFDNETADENLNYEIWSTGNAGWGAFPHASPIKQNAAGEATISFRESYLGGAENGWVRWTIYIWGTSATLRGL